MRPMNDRYYILTGKYSNLWSDLFLIAIIMMSCKYLNIFIKNKYLAYFIKHMQRIIYKMTSIRINLIFFRDNLSLNFNTCRANLKICFDDYSIRFFSDTSFPFTEINWCFITRNCTVIFSTTRVWTNTFLNHFTRLGQL